MHSSTWYHNWDNDIQPTAAAIIVKYFLHNLSPPPPSPVTVLQTRLHYIDEKVDEDITYLWCAGFLCRVYDSSIVVV